jgi:DNA mismatch repair protein MSH3
MMAELSEERARATEKLEAEANKAYATFLADIVDDHGGRLRDVINRLATVDCLLGFAAVAKEHQTYVRPEFTENETLEIVGGRHPIVETLLERPYIANSLRFTGRRSGGEPCKIITGPNMGGKSSTAKMVALIAVMAQVGSFVPANAVTMGILDGIMTRMGGEFWISNSSVSNTHGRIASDELARGRSTFMVEMVETSLILEKSTSRSLVILDELGRGTSTFDGVSGTVCN